MKRDYKHMSISQKTHFQQVGNKVLSKSVHAWLSKTLSKAVPKTGEPELTWQGIAYKYRLNDNSKNNINICLCY